MAKPEQEAPYNFCSTTARRRNAQREEVARKRRTFVRETEVTCTMKLWEQRKAPYKVSTKKKTMSYRTMNKRKWTEVEDRDTDISETEEESEHEEEEDEEEEDDDDNGQGSSDSS